MSTGWLNKVRNAARALKNEVYALYLAGRSPDLPLTPRILCLITVAYAFSPIDLIPDFIPVLGLLDDLIILPLLVRLTIRTIPEEIMVRSREQANEQTQNGKDPALRSVGRRAAIVIVLIWIAAILMIARLFIQTRQ